MELRNAAYDYVEDAGDHWDLTSSSTTTSTSYKHTSTSPLLRRRLSVVTAWGESTLVLYPTTPPAQAALPVHSTHVPPTSPLLDLMEALHASRRQRATTASTSTTTSFTLFADEHLAAWTDEQQHEPPSHVYDLIPLSPHPMDVRTTYDGRVAKHKRIGELLGEAKSPGPWTHPSRSQPYRMLKDAPTRLPPSPLLQQHPSSVIA
ncbi:hypothetical protein AaE_014277 [Aphanomyces astaci]|uniref:Uncharacterized protein n=1 Tax=Aphanomyces astaci TaxID=112090 RepID=A0A6A4ZF22_APHAT|nr:hypothetical protein AaE_014277 [Aphanomyces astaci]